VVVIRAEQVLATKDLSSCITSTGITFQLVQLYMWPGNFMTSELESLRIIWI